MVWEHAADSTTYASANISAGKRLYKVDLETRTQTRG